MKSLKITNKHDRVAVIILTVVSVSLIVAGFFVPPLGIIDGSVLTAVGELFAFATLYTVLIGINRGSDIEINHGTTNVKINNPDGEN